MAPFVTAVAVVGVVMGVVVPLAAHGTGRRPSVPEWVGTWAAAPTDGAPGAPFADRTLRVVVHTSIGGSRVRVRLSDQFGEHPLTVGHATVALPDRPGSALALGPTVRTLRFGGRRAIVVPAGGEVVSDPVPLDLPPDSDLLVSVWTPGDPGHATRHYLAMQHSYVSGPGDHAADSSGAAYRGLVTSSYYVTGVDVGGSHARGAVVVLGDSLSDGQGSTMDAAHRWTDDLYDRIGQYPVPSRLGVLDLGISGNKVLRDGGQAHSTSGVRALGRLDRDVLFQSGVRTVFVLEGINDVKVRPRSGAGAIIEGLRQIAVRVHYAGLRAVVSTLMPAGIPAGSSTEDTRLAVNRWIRSNRVFDATVDFDAVVRDPADPHRLRPAYNCGDGVHLDDLGYARMAAAVDLAVLGVPGPRPSARH